MLRIVCNTKIPGIHKVLFFVKESLGKFSNGKPGLAIQMSNPASFEIFLLCLYEN